jgi:hypothetical protein
MIRSSRTETLSDLALSRNVSLLHAEQTELAAGFDLAARQFAKEASVQLPQYISFRIASSADRYARG